ncbi:glycosyltransferase family 2 protein [Prevotella sp.]|uniref:glycosyltransferase family 2 protein n=1 Tax=Prevotella sp. TaxID=59823 RepID=UPI002F92F06E
MTNSKPLLTILITTYNRAPLLHALLGLLDGYRKRGLHFDIIVSNDHSTDDTQALCGQWQERMPNLRYVETQVHEGMDPNFIRAYSACTTDYCWLLGDARFVSYEGLNTLLQTLEQRRYDALILNCHPALTLPDATYTDINRLMADLGWQITNNASCVIPTAYATPAVYQRYVGTTFLHMGIMVENLCRASHFQVRYLSEVRVENLEIPHYTKQSWTCHPFLNFGKLWYEFVLSLPQQVNEKVKQQVLLDHNRYTQLLAPHKLPGMKVAFGRIFVENYKACRAYVPHVSTAPLWLYDLIILWVPTSWLRIMLRVFKYFRHVINP